MAHADGHEVDGRAERGCCGGRMGEREEEEEEEEEGVETAVRRAVVGGRCDRGSVPVQTCSMGTAIGGERCRVLAIMGL